MAFSLDRIFELVFKRIGIFSLAFAQDLLDFDYLAFIKDNVDLSNGLVFLRIRLFGNGLLQRIKRIFN